MDTTWTPRRPRWHALVVRGQAVTGFSVDAVDADAYERLWPGYSTHAVAWLIDCNAGPRRARGRRGRRHRQVDSDAGRCKAFRWRFACVVAPLLPHQEALSASGRSLRSSTCSSHRG